MTKATVRGCRSRRPETGEALPESGGVPAAGRYCSSIEPVNCAPHRLHVGLVSPWARTETWIVIHALSDSMLRYEKRMFVWDCWAECSETTPNTTKQASVPSNIQASLGLHTLRTLCPSQATLSARQESQILSAPPASVPTCSWSPPRSHRESTAPVPVGVGSLLTAVNTVCP
jgi:hypothetical protein